MKRTIEKNNEFAQPSIRGTDPLIDEADVNCF
jgi:hypothetical protein